METLTKCCTKCSATKPITEFAPRRDGKYGVRADCTVCRTAYSKAQYAANKEAVNAACREYYAATRDSQLTRMKNWREVNPEKVYAANKSWRARHPDKVAEYRARHDKPAGINTYDRYVRSLLRRRNGFRQEDITPELLEVRRLQLLIRRELKNEQHN